MTMSRDAPLRRFTQGTVQTTQNFLEPDGGGIAAHKQQPTLEGAAMIRTPIATTEDLDNATFFASSRLADLLRGETGFDVSEDELDDPRFDDALEELG
jgi:hypothetical protein